MGRVVYTCIIIVVALAALPAQVSRCGTDRAMAAIGGHYDQQVFEQLHTHTSTAIRRSATDSVVIPVHVIIVHDPSDAVGEGTNLSLDRVSSQIQVINQDFRRTNTNRTDTPPDFPTGDSYISFKLADIAPDGTPTDGITRYSTTDDFDEEELAIKDATRWPRDTYLNIWVANTLDDLGFALLPGTISLPQEQLDGCAVLTSAFGGPGFATFFPYNLGRTATHEIGHYLGLRHIWASNGCGPDDGIADTPKQDSSHFGCPVHPMPSCGNTGDMFMNYMDYTDDQCMNAFTVGQIDYMWAVLNGSRRSLLTAGERAFEEEPPAVVVELVAVQQPVCAGGFSGEITVTASGGVGNYRYQINGGQLQASTTFRFLQAGSYAIVAVDNDGNAAMVSDSIVLTDPAPLILGLIETAVPRCHDSQDGEITVTVTGAQGNYTLTAADTLIGVGDRLAALAGGDYAVTVQDSVGCSVDTTIQLIAPPQIEVDVIATDVTCYGLVDGAMQMVARGGVEGYTYGVNGTFFTTNATFFGYAAGTYPAYVQDSNRCVALDSFDIQEPDSLTIEVIQEDGDMTVKARGGVSPYQYRLIPGPFVVDSVFSNLVADSYTVQVIDANQCLANSTILITAVDRNSKQQEPSIFPNPASTILYVPRAHTHLRLMDFLGQEQQIWDHRQASIDVSGLAAGIYLLEISAPSGTVIERLVVR